MRLRSLGRALWVADYEQHENSFHPARNGVAPHAEKQTRLCLPDVIFFWRKKEA